uniref:Photosystem II cytochrome b559 alpha subunit n=1 Tax=Allium spicatum TaxID=105339 RepID=A0A6M8U0M3_9ASPA|nr:photosystem II cytochrome b559 alpha subunit [Allium spicatum]
MSGSTGERSFVDSNYQYSILGHSYHYYTFPIHCGLVIRQYRFSLRCIWKSSTKRIFHREPTGDSINNRPCFDSLEQLDEFSRSF